MKFALIQERKNPPDRRVVFSPEKCQEVSVRFPEAEIIVESSEVRIFPDVAYEEKGMEVKNDVSDCDVMLGVKEVPIAALIPHKKYFFFSHTIKKQPYNRDLLRAILDKNIELYDHETIVTEHGHRLIGFGRYAGLVGAYNGFRALGLRDQLFTLPKVEHLPDLDAVKAELNKIKLPAVKIVLTGRGKVAFGAKEILDHLGVKEVSIGSFLNTTFQEAVYCFIDVMDYNKRKDGKQGDKYTFYKDPSVYESNFMRFAKTADMLITGHFYGTGAPFLFTRDDARKSDFKINLVADISCDIDGPVASTLRPSTIADPFYGYDPQSETEVAFDALGAITVMAVDNLPCELPKDASEGFGEMFLEHVMPAFFNGDQNGVLKRALITKDGKLTERFKYLQAYVEGK
ncbi:NAD(P)-dependent oxidoreductase [Planktosalinus lacus]|uniref:Saccharopine dehydrogenase [NAD(+), L-lysine-forming] n=1 Tax=Planktosalinus lacus TaxID=1526573 RepID=A0A8J2VDU2_9FLAO|nr:NAD(P)-dependent oxidoreductase [Planktosalinus lacus]GGD99098.1 alanine dehydrogenase [Planktosalinus lacus]